MSIKKKIIFFSPFMAIWEHAFPESLVAKALNDSANKEITYVTCNGLFSKMCAAMPAFNVQPNSPTIEKEKVCHRCKKNKAHIKKFLGANTVDLDEYVTPEIHRNVSSHLAMVTRDNFIDFSIDNIPVGKISLYLIILRYKISTFSLNDQQWHEYLNDLEQVLIILEISKTIFPLLLPDAVVIYNSFYPINRAFYLIAQGRGVKNYWLHGGSAYYKRLQTIKFGPGHHYDILNQELRAWKKYSTSALFTTKNIHIVENHFKELFLARNAFIFSHHSQEEFNPYEFYSIPSENKIVLAVMSSRDERIGVETIGVLNQIKKSIFKDPFEWLDSMISALQEHADITLIVRIHPRDYGIKREGLLSQQAKALKEFFKKYDSVNNLIVNYPDQNVSLYQLAKFTSVCLHMGSTAAKELGMLGIPSVSFMQDGLSFPYDISEHAASRDEYFQKIIQLASIGWSYDTAKKSINWFLLENFYNLIDLSDKCKMKEIPFGGRYIVYFKKIINRFLGDLDIKISLLRARGKAKEYETINALIDSDAKMKLDLCVPTGISETHEREVLQKFHKFICHKLYKSNEKYIVLKTLREKINHYYDMF